MLSVCVNAQYCCDNNRNDIYYKKRYIMDKQNYTKHFMKSLRTLNKDDYKHGYQMLFSTLSDCPPLEYDTFIAVLNEREKQGIITWVLEDTIQDESQNSRTILIATLSLVLERKIYHGGRSVGHIEDVIVLPEYQHHRLGSALTTYAIEYAAKHGCYKTILDCKKSLVDFYSKAGMQESNIQMSLYF